MNYVEFLVGTISINGQPWLVRTISQGSGVRVAEFRDAVRQRDQRCVITGKSAVNARGSWAGFQATHIFPLAYEEHWIYHNYGRCITIQPNTGGSINSVQNGLLLTATLHILFDSYDVSINPDVGVPLLQSFGFGSRLIIVLGLL